MSSCDGSDDRMVPVRSVLLSPQLWRRHWDAIMPTKRSAHIRARLKFADEAERFLERLVDEAAEEWVSHEANRLLAEAEHGRE